MQVCHGHPAIEQGQMRNWQGDAGSIAVGGGLEPYCLAVLLCRHAWTRNSVVSFWLQAPCMHGMHVSCKLNLSQRLLSHFAAEDYDDLG